MATTALREASSFASDVTMANNNPNKQYQKSNLGKQQSTTFSINKYNTVVTLQKKASTS